MSELYINRYVIKIGGGRSRNYEVIATREDMQDLVDKLSSALKKSDAELRPKWQMEGNPTIIWQKEEGDPLTIWEKYVTEAGDPTAAETCLSFTLDNDLSKYHIRDGWIKRSWGSLACIVIIIAALFSLIGFVTTIRAIFFDHQIF